MAYLVFDDADSATALKLFCTVPVEYLEQLEEKEPGWIDTQLQVASGFIDSRLRKRCPVPFTDPAPLAVRGWLAALVTPLIYQRLGVSPTDEQYLDTIKERDRARADLQEAANGSAGLFDLPAIEGQDPSAVSKGFPRHTSQVSPFAWQANQVRDGRDEDVWG